MKARQYTEERIIAAIGLGVRRGGGQTLTKTGIGDNLLVALDIQSYLYFSIDRQPGF